MDKHNTEVVVLGAGAAGVAIAYTMRQMGLTEVLTNDHHFTQEGFTILITR